MKKNTSLKLFNHLAKKAYAQSKDKNLNWKWTDAQKFTSKNVFQKYKGQSISKLKKATVDKDIDELLTGLITQQSEAKKAKETCFNPLMIPSIDLEDTNWWMLPDDVQKFDPNLKIAVEIDGFINTGIVKKRDLPELTSIRESIRKQNLKSGEMTLIFKVLVAPNHKDDGKACSYYLLVTHDGSPQDIASEQGEVVTFMTEEKLPKNIKKKREKQQKEREEEKAKKVTKKAVRNRERPQQIEVSSKSKIEIEGEKYKQLNRTLEILREDFKDKLITKKQYQERQQQILKKFDKGGQV